MENAPSLATLAAYVHEFGQFLLTFDPAEFTEAGCDEPYGECRLQVVEGEGWYWHTGDSQYDQDHRGAWGAGFVSPGLSMEEAEEVAEGMLEEAEDW